MERLKQNSFDQKASLGRKNIPYSLLNNTIYTFREIWNIKKSVVLTGILLIFIPPLLSILYGLIPSLAVSLVERGESGVRIFWTLCGVSLVAMILSTLSGLANVRNEKFYLALNYAYLFKLNHKAMVIDYSYLESPHGQNMKALALGNVNPDDTYGKSNAAVLPWRLISMFSKLFGLFSYSAILTILNPFLIVVLLVSAIVPYLLNQWFNKYCYERREEESALTRRMVYTTAAKSDLRLVKDAIFYKTSKLLLSLYWKAVHGIISLRQKRMRVGFMVVDIPTAFLVLLQNGAAYAILIYHMLIIGNLDPALFVFYFSVITGFAGYFQGFLFCLSAAQQSSRQFCDLRSYLELPDRYSGNKDSRLSLPLETWTVEFNNVSFRYPIEQRPGEVASSDCELTPWVLKNISFCVQKGERLALVGLNGAGKTTIVKLLCGLIEPSEGEILIDGQPLGDYDRDDYYQGLSVVFQDTFLLPMTVRDNITLCCPKQVNQERLAWCLREAGIEGWIEELPHGLDTNLVKSVRDGAVDLSGGQKQKIALARALYKGGRMMILDEPTAALDPIAENELYLEYDRLIQGKTALFISHRLSSTRFCDRILLLEDGQIVETGTHQQLMQRKGKYAEMFNLQAQYYKEAVTINEP